MHWAAVADAGYWVCWDTTNNNTCDTAWWPNGAGNSRALSGLTTGTYFWQVRVQTSGGIVEADNGSWFSFTVGTPAPSTSKLSPLGGTGGLPSSVTLQWASAGDAGYWVCWDTSNNNNCDTAWWPNGGGTSRNLSGLAPGTYYWQVRVQTSAGISEADNGVWTSFTVTGPSPSDAPTETPLESPEALLTEDVVTIEAAQPAESSNQEAEDKRPAVAMLFRSKP